MRTKSLLGCIAIGCLGLYLAHLLVPGVSIVGGFLQFLKTLIFAGIILGLFNFLVKPLIKSFTFLLRLLTFGLFSLVINMAIIWLIDVLFLDFYVESLAALFWAGLIVWLLSFFIPRRKKKKRRKAKEKEEENEEDE